MKDHQMDDDIPITIDVEANTDDALRNLTALEEKAASFGQTMTNALKSSIIEGKDFSTILKELALSMSTKALNQSLLPVENMMSNAIDGLMGAILPAASGFNQQVTAFAKGGIVGGPTYFPMTNSGSAAPFGLMGEDGEEAILPLARGADGSLGVVSNGGQGNSPTNITFNVSSPDVQGFSKSQTQISAMLARAVGRGQRGL